MGVAGAALLMGCTSYHPVTAPTVVVRDEVQVQLTAAGSQALVPVLGPGVRLVEGTVRERAADGALLLTGTMLTLEGDDRRPGPGTPVAIPLPAIARVDRRMRDKGRTRLTVAVIVGGFTAVVVTALRSTRFRGQGQTAQGPGVPD